MERTVNLTFRLAAEADLMDIIRLLLDDALGSRRERLEGQLPEDYLKAFERIRGDKNHELTIVELNNTIVGTFHLTFIQYLTHQGGLRAQIEAVRVHSSYRRLGIGARMFEYAITKAKQKGCVMVQLTTDKQRPGAIRFYETLGFTATHEGMKLKL